MSDDKEPLRIAPEDLSADDWAMVEHLWQESNEVLDLAIQCYRQDREHGTQPHPAVVTEGFSEGIMSMDITQLRALLHAAIHRIEVMRLEKEAGL